MEGWHAKKYANKIGMITKVNIQGPIPVSF